MIAISIWLFIVMFFFAGAIGYATCWLCTKAKVSDAVMKKAYWHKQFELEKESHNGTKKYYINKLKGADQTILKLSEEKTNLITAKKNDTDSYYKEAK